MELKFNIQKYRTVLARTELVKEAAREDRVRFTTGERDLKKQPTMTISTSSEPHFFILEIYSQARVQ